MDLAYCSEGTYVVYDGIEYWKAPVKYSTRGFRLSSFAATSYAIELSLELSSPPITYYSGVLGSERVTALDPDPVESGVCYSVYTDAPYMCLATYDNAVRVDVRFYDDSMCMSQIDFGVKRMLHLS
ncbi:hypothetical protein HDU76_007608, partial [Blyttiomyces sp. JEL0837]